jgi:thioredoxin-like negative regulator of GroEL
MQHVTTSEELEAVIERQDSPVLVQFGKHDCPRCGPFTEAVEALKTDFAFEHLMVTVTDSPELVEQFEVAKLPAFVVLTRVDSEGEIVQAASPEEVQSAVRGACNPILRLDEDF